jgi:hypothetical protein
VLFARLPFASKEALPIVLLTGSLKRMTEIQVFLLRRGHPKLGLGHLKNIGGIDCAQRLISLSTVSSIA